MASAYLDIGVAGTNSGTLANPWTDWQSCLTNFTPGDTIYFKGNATIGTTLTLNGKTASNQPTQFIPCDVSWVPVDTTYYISGGGAITNIILITNTTNVAWKGIVFKSTTAQLIKTANTYNSFRHIFYNCGFESAPNAVGPTSDQIDNWSFINCYSLNLTVNFFAIYSLYMDFKNCKCINSGVIFDGAVQNDITIEGCLFHACTSVNSGALGGNKQFIFKNNICDSLTGNVLPVNQYNNIVEFNKFTNCITGGTRVISIAGYCQSSYMRSNYFYNNTDDIYASSAPVEASLLDFGGNLYTGATATDDYVDRPSDDFRPAGGVPATTLAVSVGNIGDVNEVFETMGWTAEPPTSTAPTFAGITKFEILSNNKFRVEWVAGTGSITSYNIYIRNASSVFGQKAQGVDSSLTGATIHCTGEMNSLLVGGTTYYCGVRAENNGTEDANVVELSNICSGAEYIQRMNIVTPVVTL